MSRSRLTPFCLVLLASFGCDSGGTSGIANTGGGAINAGGDANGGTSNAAESGGNTMGAGGSDETGGAPSGGAPATGGARNTGGAPATGGVRNSGGAPATGGVRNTGGAPATGGVRNSGGAPATGGVRNTGGAPATGGVRNTGGAPATGGTPNTGGAPATGGALNTGGTKSGTGGSGNTTCSNTSTDPRNCGSCGHLCLNLGQPDVCGTSCCAAGKCAPGFGPCFTQADGFTTCAEACASIGSTCAQQGCNGYTWFGWGVGSADSCPGLVGHGTTSGGGCTDPLPYDGESSTVRCCCNEPP